MFKYFFGILCIFLLCSVVVLAEEPSDVVTIYEVPACYEVVLVQVVSNTATPYTLVGCSKLEGDIYNWQCPCTENITMGVPQSKKGQFDFRFQYYISKPRPVKNLNATMLSQNQLYNSDILRVVNVPNFLVNQDAIVEEEIEDDGIVNFIFFMMAALIGLMILGGLFYLIIFGLRGKLKGWLRLDNDMLDTDEIKKDKDSSIKDLFITIFRRDNVERKSIAPKGKTVVNKPVEQVDDNKLDQEALDILKSLED